MKTAKMDMNTVVMVLAVGVFAWLLYSYSQRKNSNFMSSLADTSDSSNNNSNSPFPFPSDSLGQNQNYAKTNGVKTSTYGMHPSAQLNDDPSLLLPNDTNKEWSNLNPQGNGNLMNANLMSTSFLIGQDTVGSTKKNMNYQLRSEPINPQNTNTGPWLQSTIQPDTMRRPLEIGGQSCN